MMKKILKIVFLIFFGITILNININSQADEYLSDKTETTYNSTNGLPTGKANTIAQTSDGYIWIGQYIGLTRYNAKEFITFTKYNDYDLTGVTALEAVDNSLYIGTQKAFYYYLDGVYKKIPLLEETFCVNEISIDDNLVYVATNKGLFLYNSTTENITQIIDREVEKLSAYNGKAYYVIDKTLYDLTGTVKQYDNIVVTSVHYHDNLYVGTETGFYLDGTDTFYEVSSSFNINSILDDPYTTYLACDDGLYLFSIITDKLEKVKNLNISGSIEKVIKDYEGNIWIASSKEGISKITENILIDYFFEYQISSHFDSNKSVNAFVEYNGLDYIATDTGLIIIDISLPNDECFIENDLTKTLDNVRLRALAVYNDKLYIATYHSSSYALLEYDGTSFNEVLDSSVAVNFTDIRCLYNTGEELLIGTQNEIIRYDGTNFVTLSLDAQPLYIYYANETIYMCLENLGPVMLDKDFNSTSSYQRLNEETTYNSLKVLYVNDMLIFNDVNKLYYYKDNQIYKFDYELEGSIVELFYVDNTYYIGTDTQIYIMDDIFIYDDPIILDVNDGLKGNLVANSCGYYDDDYYRYYFTASNGVYMLKLNDYLSNDTITPKLAISSLEANGKKVSSLSDLVLDNDTQRITFNFDVLTYALKPKYEVYYKLDGVDDDYRLLTEKDSSEVSYTNISGGNYTFHIYVKSDDNVSDEITITFKKNFHFYELPVFWVVIVIFVVLFLIGLNTFIIKLKTRKALLRQLEYKNITLESIKAIARTIDAKDHYTNGHSLRVGYFSREIAREMGLSEEDVENIYYAGLLHDIGKIAVPDKILNKPGKLDDDEFSVIKSHTIEGAKILSSIKTIPNITLGAEYHHEKYNGKGYPKGLKGEEIPLVARIICCADCYDAMATKRVYKEPYSSQNIIDEFMRCSGTNFDPKIVPIVIKLIERGILTPNLDTSIDEL